jgi:cysteinyl-tRNA synthetase
VLNDDFNTPEALAIMHDWRAAGAKELLFDGLSVFDLHHVISTTSGGAASDAGGGGVAEASRDIRMSGGAPEDIERLARERALARAAREFDRADELRVRIESAGWQIRDVVGEPGYQLVPQA